MITILPLNNHTALTGKFTNELRQEPIGRCLLTPLDSSSSPSSSSSVRPFGLTPTLQGEDNSSDGEYTGSRVFDNGTAVTGLVALLSNEGNLLMGSPGVERLVEWGDY